MSAFDDAWTVRTLVTKVDILAGSVGWIVWSPGTGAHYVEFDHPSGGVLGHMWYFEHELEIVPDDT